MFSKRWPRPVSPAVVLAIGAVALGACGGDDDRAGGAKRGGSISVAIVDTPNTQDLARLTPSLFTDRAKIEVNYTILDEGTLREVTSSGGRQFDVVMIGPYEAPQFGRDGYITDLTRLATSDRVYRLDDVIPSVRNALSYKGKLYASPFYGESSFLMYRKDVLQSAGIAMPPNPTWRQVADIARRIDTPDTAGICLRGKPGWGELGASFTTVLNTFGATWWSAKPDGSVGRAMVDQPAFREALLFYVDLVRDAGESGAARASYNQCLAAYRDGEVAMWYDATVAAGLLEADDSGGGGQERLRPSAGRADAVVGMVLVVGARDPYLVEQGRSRLEVHLLGDRTPLSEGGWCADPRRLGGHPAWHAPVDLRAPSVPEGRPRVCEADARRHRVRAGRQPGHDPAARHPGRPVRRHPRVPRRRRPVHRAVLRGDRREVVDRLGARELPEDRVPRRAVRSSGPRGSPCGCDRLHQ